MITIAKIIIISYKSGILGWIIISGSFEKWRRDARGIKIIFIFVSVNF